MNEDSEAVMKSMASPRYSKPKLNNCFDKAKKQLIMAGKSLFSASAYCLKKQDEYDKWLSLNESPLVFLGRKKKVSGSNYLKGILVKLKKKKNQSINKEIN